MVSSAWFCVVWATLAAPQAESAESKPAGRRMLDVYSLDMVGGGSTLIVTPSGESVLIDTGSREPEHRDAQRILAAASHARLKRIDWLITTHFHSDHFGAIDEVVRRLPVRHFLDKGAGPSDKELRSAKLQPLMPLYESATAGKAQPLRAGDDVPLTTSAGGPALRLHCVASQGEIEGFSGAVDAPVAGHAMRPADESDNARSIALVLRYGAFDLFMPADITWNVEHHLAWPQNRVGEVDVYQVSHHGLDRSNNPLLLQSLDPTVAIALNGPEKGIDPNAFQALARMLTPERLYQIHYNVKYGDAGNAPLANIANAHDAAGGQWILVRVDRSARWFEVCVGKSGTPTRYPVK